MDKAKLDEIGSWAVSRCPRHLDADVRDLLDLARRVVCPTDGDVNWIAVTIYDELHDNHAWAVILRALADRYRDAARAALAAVAKEG